MSKSIVILGAGFGGIRAALQLDRALGKIATSSRGRGTPRNDEKGGWKVVLVDRNVYHVYYPRLFEEVVPCSQRSAPTRSAVGVPTQPGVGSARCQVSVKEILRGTRVEFVQGEVVGVDCKERMVSIERPPLSLPLGKGEKEGVRYDYLVFALGAGTDYFGIPGLKENACTLKSVEDAMCIREKVEGFLKRAKPQKSGTKRTEKFEIVIGGAGATGVEVAVELAYLFRKVSREQWSVTLVEALASVLWMFPKAVGEYADKRLRALGAHVMPDTCIKSAQKDGVILAPRPLKAGETEAQLVCDFLPEHEKRISADLLLWAGGVRANPLLETCGMAVDRKGRLEVDEHLRVKGMERVFAIGDNATLLNPNTKQPVPATAQAALLQGTIVAENVVRLIRGGQTSPLAIGEVWPPNIPLAVYSFPEFPAIVPLAGRDGVALMGDRVIRGFFAWLLRQIADCRYFVSITGWWRAIKLCLRG